MSSKERTADPVIEPSNPKKRPAEAPKDKQAKKLREGEASIPQAEIPVPPTSSDAHLGLHQDVSFCSLPFFICFGCSCSLKYLILFFFMQHVASSLFAAAQSYMKIKAEKDQLQGNDPAMFFLLF